MPNAGDIITNALIEIGEYSPGEPLSPDDTNFNFYKLNRIVEQWSTRSLFTFKTGPLRFPLVANQRIYTMGRAAGADWDADRPLGARRPGNGVKMANIILTGNSPEVRVPLRILDVDEYASITVQSVPTTLPVALFNDNSIPNTNIILWGTPTYSNDIELYCAEHLTKFPEFGPGAPDLATNVYMAPGYEEALILTLGESVAFSYGAKPTPEWKEQARKARSAVMGLNSSSPKVVTDVPGRTETSRITTFNYRSGAFSNPSR
jgi:hypothetical protein